mmetsp:Transcript_38662/g.71456  ORF Transcript_38662/g.71456 Transcript_38662/m.71456 type:complete len:95 (+) Transcript_38662:139-423(+)
MSVKSTNFLPTSPSTFLCHSHPNGIAAHESNSSFFNSLKRNIATKLVVHLYQWYWFKMRPSSYSHESNKSSSFCLNQIKTTINCVQYFKLKDTV